jgi:predicted nucleic acid-binding protein
MPPTWAYFDTSALVKRYIRESGSVQVRALLRRHDFLSSAVTPLEVMSALCRRRRDGDLSDDNFVVLVRRVQDDRTRWELVEVGSTVLSRAEEVIQGRVPIRALDAIHLASLVTFQAASGTRIPFVTGDDRQREAAGHIGLDVVWVGQ